MTTTAVAVERHPGDTGQDDPVSRYARRVLSGEIVSGRAVRLACERHFSDLARAETAGFPYRFDVGAAQHIIDFFPAFLTLENGQPFVLPEWLQFCYGTIFGWKCWAHPDVDLPSEHRRREGARRFVYGWFETSKGSGKALALDTPIPTPSGWSTMGDLQVGDCVFDERGRAVNVVGVSDVMQDHPCSAVVFDDGSEIVADDDHLWWTEQRYHGGDRLPTAGVPLSQRGGWRRGVRTTAQIRDTLRYPNGQYRSANHSVPLAGPIDCPEMDLPIDPYVLGAWLGDGDSDCARLTVGDQDVELLEHVASAGITVTPQRTIRYGLSLPRETCCRGHNDPSPSTGRCLACEREIDRAHRRGDPVPARTVHALPSILRSLGVMQNKHVPPMYLRASVGQRLSLLQGLMDTDGSITKANGACEFSSTNRALATGAFDLVMTLGIKATMRESAAMLYGREVSRVWRIQFHPPHDLPVFRLSRKLQHQRQRHARRRLSGDRRIVDVRPVPSVPVRCIAVDSPSHLYLAGRTMVPTHNTPSAGGIGLYGMTFDDEPHAQIYSVAYDKDQASIILNDAIRMAGESPELVTDEGLDVGKYNIANTKNGSFFRAASKEKRGKSGPRAQMVLGDEIHEHLDGVVLGKYIAGFKHRIQPLALLYTNSGSDKTSVCWEYHQKSLNVLEGIQPDEQWFAYVCHLDPCEACHAEGYRQPNDGCADCDDWTDRTVWPKVAPALGVVIHEKYLQDAVDRALSIPSEYSQIRRLNFCIWTESHQVWIPPDRYKACQVESVPKDNETGVAAAAGLDPSSTQDLTALVIALRHDDPSVDGEDVEIEGMDEFGQQVTLAYTLNFYVDLVPYFWIPEQTLLERVRTERIPYDTWKRQGHLQATPGGAIDHQAVYEFTLDRFKHFKVQKLGMDENGGRYLFMKLRDDGMLGEQIVSVGQGFKLSEAFKFIEILIAHRRLRHNGHPVLAWNFANAEPDRHKRTGALAIIKPNGGTSQTKRIDGVIATAMAIHQLMTIPAHDDGPQLFFLGGGRGA